MRRSNLQNRRVVVTGLGVISSLGIGWQEFWKNLLSGKSGISKISTFDASPYDRRYAGEVKGFDPLVFMHEKKVSYFGRASQMAIAASKLALKDANLPINHLNKNRISVYIGTTTGEIQLLERFGDHHFHKAKTFNNRFISVYPSSSLSANVALEFKLHNKNAVFATACASGNYAIGQACDQIRNNKIDYAFAGGVDAFSRIVFTGFSRAYAIAQEKCQPFDRNRKGMIPGEGAGMILLESLESALKRRAPIYAEVLGYGLSCDASNMTEPNVNGIVKVLFKALTNSAIQPEEVDYISAHGTGTVENDEAECQAINKIFGERTKQIPVSSIKSMIGHTMGAASALGVIACCLAIKDSRIPPTINYEHDDPKCAIDCVPNVSREHKVRIALNNAQAFGGNNACLVLSEIDYCCE